MERRTLQSSLTGPSTTSSPDVGEGDRRSARAVAAARVCDVHFLLLDNFSLLSFSSALEPLRIANKVMGRTRFSYACASVDGQPVRASNGLPMQAGVALADITASDLIVICSSDGVEAIDVPDHVGPALRRLERHGAQLAAICTGSFLLAKLQLLNGRDCTIHWEYEDIFAELYPNANLSKAVVVESGGLLTCSGGTAPIDMMMRFVARTAGEAVARKVADIAIHHNFRDDAVHQRLDLRLRLGTANPALLACVELMEENIETPLTTQELTDAVGLSPRQLQRHFKQHMGMGPAKYYLDLRLRAARDLVTKTALPPREIAAATGFNSLQHFSSVYRNKFGASPFEDRASLLRA